MVITQLPESTDERGVSFSLAAEKIAEFTIREVHIAALNPGHIRGNHYHAKRQELITVAYDGKWSLHWDTGPETETHCREFSGHGAVSICVPPLWSHAIRNDGSRELWLFNAADKSSDQSSGDDALRDTYRRMVT